MSSIDNNLEDIPSPTGELTLKIAATPQDTNIYGDIAGGWLVSQMDLAAEISAGKLAKGRTATVAISEMDFLCPIRIGSTVSIYTLIEDVGHSSMNILVEAWIQPPFEADEQELYKVSEARFVMVAIDDNGRIRAVPSTDY
ncbi:acyl-CoA thioesterase YciA [Oceanospirillum multiglobuliferum]|uniref:Acyl-CoA thioesterase n=1 Tax=Oceanospirillum multiglobuliferum TaxID=64969 RepID=A0A1T4NTD3_9GAMM|nr:acyl-CoA thioesterase [Oceanospirillum multiglobuliferum]OPX55669.1 acyl-CoA thioesterase [Oceanospirillum multiglobuliferum]SJZ82630.1 acyl-CoA thioesterase YciA [Oceanospirillum multiglobuliferum]